MNEPRDPNETLAADANADANDDSGAGRTGAGETTNPTVDFSSLPADSLDVGLAAAFGKSTWPATLEPRQSAAGAAQGSPKAKARWSSNRRPTPCPLKEEAGDRYRFDGEIARGGMGAVLRGRDVDLGPRPGDQGAAREVRQSPRRRPAVHRRGPDRRATPAPGRGAGLRYRPVRRPAVLHDEAGERADARGHSRANETSQPTTGLACWASPCKCRRRWRMPTPRASSTATSSRPTSWWGRSARSR